MRVELKSSAEIELMREAAGIVATILDELAERIEPGVSTAELDAYAEGRLAQLGALPAFKGYQGFPATLCTSINDQVVHGIPREDAILQEGDILSVDFGVKVNGFFGDSARTFAVGRVDTESAELIRATEEALECALKECIVGARLGDIGHAVQSHVESRGYSVVRDFVGHGIGRRLHEDPKVKNYGEKGRGWRLEAGVVLAIEPMVNLGAHEVEISDDNWTVVTRDRKRSAHFEHMVAITEDGPEVLTRGRVN